MSLGEKICRLRGREQMSQEALAEKLGVSRQSVSKWETDASVPELEKLVAMSRLFGVSLDELVLDSPQVRQTEEKQTEGQAKSWSMRQVIGIVVLCFGLLTMLLLSIYLGIETGLCIGCILICVSIALLTIKRHGVLYIGWGLLLVADIGGTFLMRFNWRVAPLAVNWNVAAIYGVTMWLWLIAMAVSTVVTFRRENAGARFGRWRKPVAVLGAVLGTALLLWPLALHLWYGLVLDCGIQAFGELSYGVSWLLLWLGTVGAQLFGICLPGKKK